MGKLLDGELDGKLGEDSVHVTKHRLSSLCLMGSKDHEYTHNLFALGIYS